MYCTYSWILNYMRVNNRYTTAVCLFKEFVARHNFLAVCVLRRLMWARWEVLFWLDITYIDQLLSFFQYSKINNQTDNRNQMRREQNEAHFGQIILCNFAKLMNNMRCRFITLTCKQIEFYEVIFLWFLCP